MAEWENVSVEAVAVDREDGMDMFWVWLDLVVGGHVPCPSGLTSHFQKEFKVLGNGKPARKMISLNWTHSTKVITIKHKLRDTT